MSTVHKANLLPSNTNYPRDLGRRSCAHSHDQLNLYVMMELPDDLRKGAVSPAPSSVEFVEQFSLRESKPKS